MARLAPMIRCGSLPGSAKKHASDGRRQILLDDLTRRKTIYCESREAGLEMVIRSVETGLEEAQRTDWELVER